jgi:hypothetical protein
MLKHGYCAGRPPGVRLVIVYKGLFWLGSSLLSRGCWRHGACSVGYEPARGRPGTGLDAGLSG